MLTEKLTLKTETVFSDDKSNRYLLRKEWDAKKPKATIIMTNPSAADLMTIDYTTLYILNNISKLDFGSVDIVNMSSKVTTKLNAKLDLDVEIEKENAEFILKSAEKSDKIIIAWGKIGENNQRVRMAQDNLLKLLEPFKAKLCCIAMSEDGESGFHPLAPQIRFEWVLRDFIPPKPLEAVKGKKKLVKPVASKISDENPPIEAVELIPENQ
ncbi:MAG: DUF1643 domain-containing protein [Synergistaceae bacterium]|nr:DUF1643 domain-containing protein [Synergistaceae bacterium]